MIVFAFLLIFHLIFRFHVKFKQGIQGYQNILNNKQFGGVGGGEGND